MNPFESKSTGRIEGSEGRIGREYSLQHDHESSTRSLGAFMSNASDVWDLAGASDP